MAKSEIIFYLSSSFFLGLTVASFGLSLWWVFLFWITSVGVIRVFSLEMSKAVVVALLCAGILGLVYYHAFAVFKDSEEVLPKTGQEFIAVVNAEPKLSERSQVVSVRLLSPYRGSVDIITQPLANLSYGEEIKLQGVVQKNTWPKSSSIIFPKIEPTGKMIWSPKTVALNLKNKLLSSFKLLLSTDEAALLSGLTFGTRVDFSQDLKEAMKRSGTTHLVALSGYNISILILAVERLLRSRVSKRFFFIAATCLIGAFVLMVGGEASIVRAAIMGWLVLLASETGRLYSFRNAVLYAALAMSLWNPALPGSDLGFQLSFLSLLGMVLLQPVIGRWLGIKEKDSSLLSWKENLVTTIAAQLGVLPALLLSFGTFSLVGVISNILILWIVPWIMALGFFVALLGLVHVSLGIFFQPFLHLVLSYVLLVINLTALVPPLQVVWNIWLTAIYYAFFGWLIWYYSFYEKPNA